MSFARPETCKIFRERERARPRARFSFFRARARLREFSQNAYAYFSESINPTKMNRPALQPAVP